MSATALPAAERPKTRTSTWTFWGRLLLLPYVLVFLVFVLFPVGYGLWLARDPQNYVKLAQDPVFFRTVFK